MKGLIKEILKGSGADYIEIRIEDTREAKISFQGDILENVEESKKFGGNVRALTKGGWGFVTFNSLNALKEKIKVAVKNAQIASRSSGERTRLARVSPVEDKVAPHLVKDPKDISLASKVGLLKGYNDGILSFNEYIKSSTIRYFDRDTKLTFANSEGTYIECDKTDIGCNIMAVAVKGDNTQYGFIGRGSSNNYNVVLNLEDEIRAACANATALLDAATIKGGEYTVILDPNLTGTFIHEAFGHLSEGDNIYENSSLQEVMKLGRKMGNRCLNIYDSGLDKGTRGYIKYDDEGVPAKKTCLISEGELVGRLHSRETAGRMGDEATGNARALNYKFPPICRMRNTCIGNGNASFPDMIKDIKHGVYAKSAFGGQTNGELFTFTAGEAWQIRDGRIAEKLRDVTLSGNVFTTLANIDMIGNDFAIHDSAGGCGKGGQMPLPVSHGGPHIRVNNVIIGGKGE